MSNAPHTSRRVQLLSRTSSLAASLAKILVLSPLNALAVWAALILLGEQLYWLLALLVVGCGLIDYIFLSHRAYPWRYLVPGLFFMVVMVVYPICYTVVVAFTNFGTGHLLSKVQAIEHYTSRYTLREDLPEYSAAIFRSSAGKFAILLKEVAGASGIAGPGNEPSGNGEPSNQSGGNSGDKPGSGWLLALDGRITPLEAAEVDVADEDGDSVPDRISGYEPVPKLAVFKYLADLQKLEFHLGGYVLKMRSPDRFATYSAQFRYDRELDALVDTDHETVYYARDGNFVADSGRTLDTGYRTAIGWRNFRSLARNPQISGPFFRVFAWTFTWAALSVLTTFALGLFLAVLLNDNKLKFRKFYRVVLILPYALPAFISALIWRGLFNTEVGFINSILKAIIGVGVPWLQDPFWAKAALILVNLWLGFPYMMLVCLGALQSIPHELYEASVVDGASGWQQFWRVTLPLLLISVTPLLIASFAFNFNNFSVVYLVTKGRPAIPGTQTPAGATDILITYTYRLAFESAAGTDYGLASAVTILIFLIVGTLSWINFRFTGALEEVRENA